MEDNRFLFSLSIDPATKSHLSDTAKWAKFFSVAGFIVLLLLIGVGVYSSITISRFEESFRENSPGGRDGESLLGPSVVLTYVILAIIGVFPLLYTFRFANKMQEALRSNNQDLLTAAFKNLKICFRYLGIVTVISLSLTALLLVFSMAGLALS